VLVAQSALETGWGRKVTTGAGGGSSFNLFNIKAGQSWSGEIAQVSTLEFDKGVAAMEKAAFRVYDSLADAFADYVDLLKSSPRYQKALEVAADSKQFLQELQRAGYATDPGYAEKILGILDQENYQSVLSTLKKF
jgi:flagellar protein FlgJ